MRIARKLGIVKTPYRILALDGGGVRGIITMTWLERLEKHLGAPLHSHFDLIAGTSIGAVIGCAISKGMTAAEIKSIWQTAARQAFSKPVKISDHVRRIAAIGGFMPKYDDSGLSGMLRGIFAERSMGSLSVRPTLALSYNPDTHRVHVFSNTLDDHAKLPIWQVCRASTAAPLFFSPHNMVVDNSGREVPLMDGGVTANNPVIVAITQAVQHSRNTGQNAALNNIVVASLGTGTPAEGSSKEPRSIFGHGSIILKALFDGATGTDHVTARDFLPAENYWRFQTSIPARLEPLDGVENLDELQAIALAQLADGLDHRMGQLARKLQGKSLEKRFWERQTEASA
jgi:predicted acylesterase/phospholipase RssA